MKHGANIYKYALDIGCEPEKIIDFSSNINLHHVKNDVDIDNNLIVKYADSSYKDLKKTIAKKYDLKKSQIALFNGATSAIYELLKSLHPNKVYIYAPLYGEYEKAIHTDTIVVKINRFEDIYQKPSYNSTVVFVNPSTPDAKYYDLKKLFNMWKEQNCTVILDESFLEFEDLKSYRDKIKTYDKLYIIQSFSKFYSCAGVRIGAIFSNKNNIKNLKQPIWNLSSFDVEFLIKRLKDKKFAKKSIKLHKKRKKQLKNILSNSKLFSCIYESDSNFFLVKTSDVVQAFRKSIFKHLLEHKILVRTCGSFDFLDDDYLRFAVKDKKAHKKLKLALGEFYE